MGHSIGVSDSCYRASASEVLNDYLKAVPSLSVNYSSEILHKQVDDLKEKSRIEVESLSERQKKQDEKLLELQAQVNRLASILT